MDYTFSSIGIIHSCFKEKFGIPRQPGLVEDAVAELELYPSPNIENALKGLEGFSHIWVVFVFHLNLGRGWKPMVRPPRLGGNKKTGVFATRSGFRPNPIGLSAVKLETIYQKNGKSMLRLTGIDFLDKTPVLDIKPYLPYADSIHNASAGFAVGPPSGKLKVEFSPQALLVCREMEKKGTLNLERMIRKILEIDPHPAYYGMGATSKKQFGMRIFDVDVKWEIKEKNLIVTNIEKIIAAT